ncbi:MAG: hypothetical protein IPG94_20795 [Kineosporiaceae bacterium]|nr:hypothetical protein [Kineosporiaceae bacterium]
MGIVVMVTLSRPPTIRTAHASSRAPRAVSSAMTSGGSVGRGSALVAVAASTTMPEVVALSGIPDVARGGVTAWLPPKQTGRTAPTVGGVVAQPLRNSVNTASSEISRFATIGG